MNLSKIILFSFFVLLSGCNSISSKLGYVEKSKAAQELSLVIEKKQHDIELANQKILAAKDSEMEQLEGNFQQNADELYGAQIALEVETIKSRPVEIASTHVIAAAAFGPKPSVDGVLKQQELLKKELDIAKVTNEDLQKRLNATLDEAGAAHKLLDEKTKKVTQVIKDKQDIEKINDEKISAAQSKLNDANGKIISQQNEDLKSKEARNKERMWLIGIFTFVGIALGIAAIFAPVLKKQFGIGAAVSLGIAIGIVLIPQWVITTVACVLFTILIIWVAYDIVVANRAASNTYRAIQDIKVNKPEVFKEVAPVLSEWQTKYTKDGSTVPDVKAMDHIDAVLKKTDSL